VSTVSSSSEEEEKEEEEEEFFFNPKWRSSIKGLSQIWLKVKPKLQQGFFFDFFFFFG
jgi:hypothetical protein